MGAALGVAIVAFVAFTVVGVYNLQKEVPKTQRSLQQLTEAVQQMDLQQNEFERQILAERQQWEERSRQLREEIIQSNQVAIDLVIKELRNMEEETDEETDPSPAPLTPRIIPGEDPRRTSPMIEQRAMPQREVDALKYRFRQEQQRIQEQWRN